MNSSTRNEISSVSKDYTVGAWWTMIYTNVCCSSGPPGGTIGFFFDFSGEPFCSSFLLTSAPLLLVLLPFPFFCSIEAEPAETKKKEKLNTSIKLYLHATVQSWGEMFYIE